MHVWLVNVVRGGGLCGDGAVSLCAVMPDMLWLPLAECIARRC